MPFIRVTTYIDETIVDVNIKNIITFGIRRGDKYTTVELRDNITLTVNDTPRQMRGYIKRAEGTLPEKVEEPVAEA